MNSKKVGKFISEERKKKNLTQKQLADLLGVTDKAVSRWETGKGYPDIEILKKLSEALDVSVNELLSGEKIPEEKITETAETHIVSALRQEKQTKKLSKIVVAAFFVFTFLFCAGFVFVFNSLVYERNTEYTETTVIYKQTGDVIKELRDILRYDFNIATDGVFENIRCTDFNIEVSKKNKVLSFDMTLIDNIRRKKVSIILKEDDENWQIESVPLKRKDEKDGLPYTVAMKALENINWLSLAKKHGSTDFDKFIISIGLPVIFSGKEANFAEDKTYLFDGKNLENITDTKKLMGTYYDMFVTPWTVDTDGVMASCCNVYVKA